MSLKKSLLLATSMIVVLLAGCRTYPDYTGDFRFPILRGDVERGQQAFIANECHQCHLVDGVDLPAYPGQRMFNITLGGELIFVKTYASLVTSIINPDHIISEQYLATMPRTERRSTISSPMYLKEDMTVAEMIDIVTFLNSRYSLLPGYTEYFY